MFSYTYQRCYALIFFQTLHFYQKFTILKNFQIRIKVTEWCTDWVCSDFKISLRIVHNLYSCLPNRTLMLRHRIFSDTISCCWEASEHWKPEICGERFWNSISIARIQWPYLRVDKKLIKLTWLKCRWSRGGRVKKCTMRTSQQQLSR